MGFCILVAGTLVKDSLVLNVNSTYTGPATGHTLYSVTFVG
jgi:hypothetical protein